MDSSQAGPVTSETNRHQTPNGGDYSVMYYQDAQGNPVDKKLASKAEIVEFKDNGEVVGRTYGELGRSGG
jgi:hypothetical protein